MRPLPKPSICHPESFAFCHSFISFRTAPEPFTHCHSEPFTICHPEPFTICHPEPFTICHPEPFTICHPERSEGSENAQGKLREESQCVQGKLREESQGTRINIAKDLVSRISPMEERFFALRQDSRRFTRDTQGSD